MKSLVGPEVDIYRENEITYGPFLGQFYAFLRYKIRVKTGGYFLDRQTPNIFNFFQIRQNSHFIPTYFFTILFIAHFIITIPNLNKI